MGLASDRLIVELPFTKIHAVTLANDRLWVLADDRLAMVDLASGTVETMIEVELSVWGGDLLALWSRRSIAYAVGVNDDSNLLGHSTHVELYDLYTGQTRTLTKLAGSVRLLGVESEGDDLYATQIGGDGGSPILAINLEDGTMTAEIEPQGFSHSAAMSPDGRWIAAVGAKNWSQPEEQGCITLYKLAEPDSWPMMIDLPKQPSHARGLEWTPDSRYLYFILHSGPRAGYSNQSLEQTYGLWRADTHSSQVKQIVPSVSVDHDPIAVSPDGRAVLIGGYPFTLIDVQTGVEYPLHLPDEAIILAWHASAPAPTTLPPPEVTVTTSTPPTPQVATIPVPAATPSPTPSHTSPGCPVVLFARERDLWRTNLDGDAAERLTEGNLLDWQPGRDDWWVTALSTPVQVSPDGRWITFFREHNRVLIDVTAHTQIGLPMPHALIGDWSPDSRYFAYGTGEGLYRYDVQEGKITPLVDSSMLGGETGASVREVVWSSDGRFIGFACCFASLSEGADASIGQVWTLEVVIGRAETVGEIKAYVSKSNPLCWTTEGQLAAAEELADRNQAVRCSKQGLAAFPRIAPGSPEGTKQAVLGPSSSDDSFWTGSTRLTVSETTTGEVLWQREISGTIKHITWSPDGQYLLLDDDLDRSPLWRIRSDGSGDLERVIEDGFLVGVIPPTCRPDP